MNELITISKSTIDGETVNTVNARDLHSFLDVGKDFSTWIKVQVDRARLVENRDYLVFPQKGENIMGLSGRPTIDYFLAIDAAKHVAMMSGTDKGFEVRDYFIECERRAQQQLFKLPATYSEALRALADETERRELAERTKAEIGHRREATAMNTASQLSKKNRKLEEQLDHLKEYVTIKRMSMIFHGQQFNWRELKSASILMELPAIDVFDQNYETVKAYHVDVWREVYAIGPDGSTYRVPDEPENRADVN